MSMEESFFSAVREDDLDEVESLLAENPDLVHARMPGDSSILDHQVWENLKKVQVSEDETRFGMALHYAALWGKSELARLLLSHGADPNAVAYENNHEQTTPVVLAAWEGGLEMLELILEAGGDPNAQSSNGVTPLSTAQRHQNADRVELLKRFGAVE
ncbi:MAG: ankyrin repeat domain-containing protein [Pseudomonadota bacterium]